MRLCCDPRRTKFTFPASEQRMRRSCFPTKADRRAACLPPPRTEWTAKRLDGDMSRSQQAALRSRVLAKSADGTSWRSSDANSFRQTRRPAVDAVAVSYAADFERVFITWKAGATAQTSPLDSRKAAHLSKPRGWARLKAADGSEGSKKVVCRSSIVCIVAWRSIWRTGQLSSTCLQASRPMPSAQLRANT